jgi:hypothetical protein
MKGAITAPRIAHTAMFTIIKSISHAKNLSLHLARMISFGTPCGAPAEGSVELMAGIRNTRI